MCGCVRGAAGARGDAGVVSVRERVVGFVKKVPVVGVEPGRWAAWGRHGAGRTGQRAIGASRKTAKSVAWFVR